MTTHVRKQGVASLMTVAIKAFLGAIVSVPQDTKPESCEAALWNGLSQFPFGESFLKEIVRMCGNCEKSPWLRDNRRVLDRVSFKMTIYELGKTTLEVMFRDGADGNPGRKEFEKNSCMSLKLHESGTFEIYFALVPLLEAMPTLNCQLRQQIEIWKLDESLREYDQYYVAICGQYWPFRAMMHAYDLADPTPVDEKVSLFLHLLDLVTQMLAGDVKELFRSQHDSSWHNLSALCPVSTSCPVENKRRRRDISYILE